MQDEINEKISRLIDGDLGHVETLELLKQIQSDESLRHKVCRYQGISNALKSDIFYDVSIDFSRKIFQEIQQEPAHFLPQLKPKKSTAQILGQQTKRRWFAVAASATVAAVIVWQGARHGQMPDNQQSTIAMNTPQQSLPASYPSTKNNKQPHSRPLNAQFNDYLQAHNSSVYINGEANFKPYARVASYRQD